MLTKSMRMQGSGSPREDVGLETILAAQAGDVDAYRTIVLVFERPVHHTVFRMVGSRYPADIEDITQDIFFKLFRNLGAFDPGRGTKLSSWVFTFVKNYCFDVLKRKQLNTIPIHGNGSEERAVDLSTESTEPRDVLESRETQIEIAHAVDQLPREQKLAFVLREYEDLPYSQIAEITATTEGTVKSRIHRAKEALRLRLRRLVVEAEGDVS